MNINVNIRNKTKLVKTLRWYTYKINMTLADNNLSYKTCYQIKLRHSHWVKMIKYTNFII